MKKHVFLSFIVAFSLIKGVVFAAGEVAGASVTVPQKDSPTEAQEVKIDPLLAKKQKIESDLRVTITKLKGVIDRTALIVEVLTKKGLDMKEASENLSLAKSSLENAVGALDQFAGITIPETKNLKIDQKQPEKTQQILKDPLKKAEDALKDSKNALISSISAIKDSIAATDNKE